MSYVSANLIPCPTIQGILIDNFETCNAEFKRDYHPFFDFLVSDMNSSGLKQKVYPGAGKLRTVELIYGHKIPLSEVTEKNGNITCDATTKRGESSVTYTIDPLVGFKVEQKITLLDWVTTCRDNPTQIALIIQKMMNAMVDKLAVDFSESVVTNNIGVWNSGAKNYDGTAIVGGKLVVPTEIPSANTVKGGEIQKKTLQHVRNQLMRTKYCGTPIFFGGMDYFEYLQMMNLGCCASDGLSVEKIAAAFGYVNMWDENVATALGGDDYTLITQPHALAVLEFAENEQYNGINMDMGSDFVPQVYQDPASGLKFNLNISFRCPGEVHLIMWDAHKVVALPTDVYAAGDSNSGVTYVNKLQVVNT